MSALRSAIQELANENLDDLHVDQLADDLVEIELVSGLLETQRVRRLSVYGSKGGPLSHGFSSPTAFLKTRCRMAAGRARRLVAASIAIGRAKEVFRAWCDGRLSSDQLGACSRRPRRCIRSSSLSSRPWSMPWTACQSQIRGGCWITGVSRWTDQEQSQMRSNKIRLVGFHCH